MDGGLVLIFAFVIVITSVAGLIINGVVQKVLDYKRDKQGIPRHGSPIKQINSELADRTDLIEDRLRVLERLATDKGQLLSDEIEALRKETPALTQKEPS
ncbi:MAG: hypothetical protein AAGK17_04325 [Pseudomonadota bacterium]